MPVVRKALESGYTPVVILIGAQKEEFKPAETIIFDFIQTTPGRMDISSALRLVYQIFKILKIHKPDLIHTITLKYVFMAGLAALVFPKIKKIYTLAGLGYLFRSEEPKAKILRFCMAPLLKIILKAPNALLIFQNKDDLRLMTGLGFAKRDRCKLIRGSGVDLEKFKPVQELKKDLITILMPTRLIREKGVEHFVMAARILKKEFSNVEFKIAGGLTKHNPAALSAEDMQGFTQDGCVQWLGHVNDMPGVLAASDIIVYPSFYGEGIPRVLLEAAAMGKPIITTDNPGCRETVEDGQNGFLVPIKNVEALVKAIKILIADTGMRRRMGLKSRVIAEQDFDLHLITAQTVEVYKNA